MVIWCTIFSDYNCKTSEYVIDKSNPKWQHYFLCGYKGMEEQVGHSAGGMDVMLEGSVPKSAGLSSSSALVCCAALATMRANNKTLTKVGMN